MINKGIKTLLYASPLSGPRALAQLDKAVWYCRFRTWCRENACPESNWRPAIYEDVFHECALAGPVNYLEFGTYEGRSMRWMLGLNKHADSRFVGFDTFEGLPEAWEAYGAGHFSTSGKFPDIQDGRCSFVKGLFQDALPEFLKTFRRSGTMIVHLDADLYSSTSFVLHQVAPLLRSGDILLFDEFHTWMDEFRAFQHFLAAYPLRCRVLRRSPDWSQVAMVVTDNPHATPRDGARPAPSAARGQS